MIVYIVLAGAYGETEIVSVHLTAEGAERAADAHGRGGYSGAYVEQYALNP